MFGDTSQKYEEIYLYPIFLTAKCVILCQNTDKRVLMPPHKSSAMIQEFQLRVLPQQAVSESSIIEFIAQDKGLDARTIKHVRVLKRSIDARQRMIFVNLKVRIYINEFPQDDEFKHIEYGDISSRPRVIVVGAGPGGLFAALRLIELGLKPIVLERGKNVHDRKKDLSAITKTQNVDADSNYCFGEGEQALTRMANFTPAVRSAEISKRFSMCFANTGHQPPFYPMHIPISGQTNYRKSLRTSATRFCAVAAKCISKPK